MHYAEFAEDEVSHFVRLSVPCTIIPDQLTLSQSAALLAAIKEYEQSKWKVIGQKVGKPAKVSGVSSGCASYRSRFYLEQKHVTE
jgi:hypothetical protein